MIRAKGHFRTETLYDIQYADGTINFGVTASQLSQLYSRANDFPEYSFTIIKTYPYTGSSTPPPMGTGYGTVTKTPTTSTGAGGLSLSTNTILIIAGIAVLALVGGNLFKR